MKQAKLLNAQTQEAVQRVQHITKIQSGKVSLAALPSLAIVAVGLLPLIALSRQVSRARQ